MAKSVYSEQNSSFEYVEFQMLVNERLHPTVFRFYSSDGEELSEFEDVLDSGGFNADIVHKEKVAFKS